LQKILPGALFVRFGIGLVAHLQIIAKSRSIGAKILTNALADF
jgi:hypothetical protein